MIKLYLSPMAGYTDMVFRQLAYKHCLDIAVTEMVSAKAIIFNDKKTFELLRKFPGEENTGVQIFGSDIESISKATYILNDFGYKYIDINMGCPAPKIVKTGAGSALIKDPDLVYYMVRSAVKNSNIPITVKTRKSIDNILSIDMLKAAEDAGASAVTIHGRTREDYYNYYSDWDYISKVKNILKIPVIGNGDISGAGDALDKLKITKVDGLAIGRGAIGNPWIFEEIKAALSGGEYLGPSLRERLNLLVEHLNLEVKFRGNRQGILNMRKNYSYYFKNMKNSKALRSKLNIEKEYDKVVKLIENYMEEMG